MSLSVLVWGEGGGGGGGGWGLGPLSNKTKGTVFLRETEEYSISSTNQRLYIAIHVLLL